LLQENVLQKSDLDQAPFNADGGFNRLNKIFNLELDNILTTLNQQLYNIIA